MEPRQEGKTRLPVRRPHHRQRKTKDYWQRFWAALVALPVSTWTRAQWLRVKPRVAAWRRHPFAALAYVLVSLVLFAWNQGSTLRSLSSAYLQSCEQTDVKPGDGSYWRVYSALLHWISRPAHKDLTVVYIPADLAEIQQNTCKARSYLSDVLKAIDKGSPAVVVVDKYFGAFTCKSGVDLDSTRELIDTVRQYKPDLIVGLHEKDNKQRHGKAEPCIVPEKGLDFGNAPHLQYGLLRASRDLARIPLQWETGLTAAGKPLLQDTLALASMRAFATDIDGSADFRNVLASERAPFASLTEDLHQESTTELLCSPDVESNLRQRWSISCPTPLRATQPLLGRVVIIGAQSTSDELTVLHGHFWGYELQAHYLSALLTGSYLLAAPASAMLFSYAVFFAANFLLFSPGNFVGKSTARWFRALLVRVAVVLGLLAVFTAAFISAHCLPPFGAFSLALVALVTNVAAKISTEVSKPLKQNEAIGAS